MDTQIIGILAVNGMFPAGYYSCRQCGDYENTHIRMWYEGIDETEVEGIDFCYWEDEFPETDTCY